MIGQSIGDYRFVELLATGDFGAVYRAQDLKANREVAIRQISPSLVAKPEFAQRFANEAPIIAKLEHPNILPIYAYWQDEKGAFLVMRLIQGASLKERIRLQGALSLAETERYLKQIAGALSVAHQAKIAHGEVNAANLLLDAFGNAYLDDFGISRPIEKASPSPAADIQSLGIMLYEMLTGSLINPDKALPDISKTRPDLSPALNIILQKAAVKEESLRYTSVEALLADFAALKFIPVDKNAKIEANRQTMLENVRHFWIDGVLEQSSYKAVFSQVGLLAESAYIENASQSVLRVQDLPQERIEADTKLLDIFERLNGKMLILGEAGSGKTTSLLRLAKDLLERAAKDNVHAIPVIFHLSAWAEKRQELESWMLDELNTKYQVPRKIGQHWLEQEQILPLLDGLDELANDARNACVDAINAFRTKHILVDMVITSRLADYKALQTRLFMNGAIAIGPLRQAAIKDYFNALGEDGVTVARLIGRDEKLRSLVTNPLMLNMAVLAYRGVETVKPTGFDTLEARRKALVEDYLNRVLGDGEQTYSEEKSKHYLKFIAQQMNKHSQSIFNPEQLQPSWLDKWNLKRFSYVLGLPLLTGIFGWLYFFLNLYIGAYVLALAVMIQVLFQSNSGGWGINAGNAIFAICAMLGMLPGIGLFIYQRIKGESFVWSWKMKAWALFSFFFLYIPGFFTMLLFSSVMYFETGDRIFELGGQVAGIVLTAFGVAFPGFFAGLLASSRYLFNGKVLPLESIGWSFRNIPKAAINWAIPAFLYGVLIAFSPTVSYYFTVGYVYLPNIFGVDLPDVSIVYLVIACVGLSTMIFGLILSGYRERRVGTYQEIRLGFGAYWLWGIFGAIIATVVNEVTYFASLNTLTSVYVGQWNYSYIGTSIFGLSVIFLVNAYLIPFISLIFALRDGGYGALQHRSLRMILAGARILPMNLRKFLDFAESKLLLRRVGGGYIFMHKLLLDYFVSLEVPAEDPEQLLRQSLAEGLDTLQQQPSS